MNNFIKNLIYPLEKKDIFKSVIILFFSLICTLLELLGISLFIPMISIFVGDQYLNYSEYFFFLNNFDREDYLKIFLIIFLLIYFINSLMLITLTFLQSSFNYSIYSKLSKKFLKII